VAIEEEEVLVVVRVPFFWFIERKLQLHWFHGSTDLADLGFLRVEVTRSHPMTHTHIHTHTIGRTPPAE
jgi:hypothetical protein